MRVDGLDHVNIRTPLFEETLAFYERALGLCRALGAAASEEMRHLNIWLLDANGAAPIHVNATLPGESAAAEGAPSRLDHIALACGGLAACMERLGALGVPFHRVDNPARGTTQLNLRDPNGIKIELSFRD